MPLNPTTSYNNQGASGLPARGRAVGSLILSVKYNTVNTGFYSTCRSLSSIT